MDAGWLSKKSHGRSQSIDAHMAILTVEKMPPIASTATKITRSSWKY
jgi:hypothetical protein